MKFLQNLARRYRESRAKSRAFRAASRKHYAMRDRCHAICPAQRIISQPICRACPFYRVR